LVLTFIECFNLLLIRWQTKVTQTFALQTQLAK